jgi:hypothetical protein
MSEIAASRLGLRAMASLCNKRVKQLRIGYFLIRRGSDFQTFGSYYRWKRELGMNEKVDANRG